MKKTIYLFLLIILVLSNMSLATDNTTTQKQSINYYVDSFDIDVKVNENKTLDVTEEIGVVFYNSQSKIVRKISKDRYERISNIVISDDYSYDTSEEEDVVIITINSGKKEYKEQKYFKLSYTYNYGKDINLNNDSLEFYFVDSLWDVSVTNVHFTIRMPFEIDESRDKFIFDVQGGEPAFYLDYEIVSYSIDGNVINGYLNGLLNAHQYFKVKIYLPNNYFKNEDIIIDAPTTIILIVPILCLLLSIWNWSKTKCFSDNVLVEDDLSGKDDHYSKKIIRAIFKDPYIKNIILIYLSLLSTFAVVAYENNSIGTFFYFVGISLFYTPFYVVGISPKVWGKGCVKIFWLGFTIFHSSAFYIVGVSQISNSALISIGYILNWIYTLIMIFIFNYQINKK